MRNFIPHKKLRICPTGFDPQLLLKILVIYNIQGSHVMLDFKHDFRYEEEKSPTLKNAAGQIHRETCTVLCGSSGCGLFVMQEAEFHFLSTPS